MREDSLSVGGSPGRKSWTERREWVERFLRSGQTQQEFARRHELKLCTFRAWLYRHRREASNRQSVRKPLVNLVEVLGPSAGTTIWVGEVEVRGGTRVRFSAQMPAPLLRQTLLSLRAC
jgi:transposase-like protein